MISIRYTVLLLLFLNVLLNVLAKECTIRTEKRRFFQGPRNSLINFIARKKGYDVKGWIDISLVDENFNSIDIRVHNDKIICNQGNQILEVSSAKQTLIQQTDSATYNEVLFNHIHLAPNSRFINPMPVMKSTQYSHASDSKSVLPDNFEGYVVCEKKDSNALLIPKNFETVEFISPPWSVRVSIDLYRNPISQYGRQFRVTIMDNINILMNNQSSFTWPVPFESFAEVYDFHLAVKDSKEGRFCILERDFDTYELNLNCHSWRRSYKLGLTNALFAAGFLGMNVIQGISYPFLGSNRIVYYTDPAEGNRDPKKILLEDESKKPDGTNTHVHESYDKNKKSKKWLGSLSNLIYLGIVGIVNGIYGILKIINIKKNLYRFNREFEEAPLYYPWKLEYPENYYTPNNVEVENTETSDAAHTENAESESNNLLVTEQTTDSEKTEESEDPFSDPTIIKQVEEFVVDS